MIVTHPLRGDGNRREPFPTVFWLTCPALIRAISRLEAGGIVGELEALIAGDDALRQRVEDDHRRYIERRLAVLDASDLEWARVHGMADAIELRGVGGTADFTTVKCLHAHYAQHLAMGSAIGELVEARWSIQPCRAVTASR